MQRTCESWVFWILSCPCCSFSISRILVQIVIPFLRWHETWYLESWGYLLAILKVSVSKDQGCSGIWILKFPLEIWNFRISVFCPDGRSDRRQNSGRTAHAGLTGRTTAVRPPGISLPALNFDCRSDRPANCGQTGWLFLVLFSVTCLSEVFATFWGVVFISRIDIHPPSVAISVLQLVSEPVSSFQ